MYPLEVIRRAAEEIGAIWRGVRQLQQSAGFIRDALGRIEERQLRGRGTGVLADYEFKAYSQWGEDGIIQHLIRCVPIAHPVFVEFGVESYTESNTRFLLTQNNWSGLVLDGGGENIATIKKDPIYWRHNLKAVEAFVKCDNINSLLRNNGLTGEIGLLSIDVDGNDYWIWEAIDAVNPAIVIVEYNARFGPERAVTVPYDPTFIRAEAHYSMIYYGASLAALTALGRRKGYAFVGANRAGNNAFFVRRDLKPETLPEITAGDGFVPCQFRESRDESGHLAFLSPAEEAAILDRLPLTVVPP
jgi:hypothetical protein